MGVVKAPESSKREKLEGKKEEGQDGPMKKKIAMTYKRTISETSSEEEIWEGRQNK